VNELTEQQTAFLHRFGFDEDLFRSWQQDLAEGRRSSDSNAVTEELLAPPPGTIEKTPNTSSSAYRELAQLGREVIAKGQLGVVVLNGGMATRFGGVVKGVVPVLGKERSFLALCIEDMLMRERECDGRIPMFFMNSFATDEATKAHMEAHSHFGADPEQIEHFTQFVSLRMDRKGKIFKLDSGDISPYGPGHGDFAAAFRDCGALQRFIDGGGRYVLVRNVDNLGARVDPAVLGYHVKAQKETTVEVAPKWPEDVGGSPYLYQGRVQLVEQVRYPKGFDANIVDVFNTNTLTFSAASLDRSFDLGWYYVEKTVEDRAAVQMEHLIGEMTAHLSTAFLQVRRSGPDTRFLPIKTPEDLEAAREEIADMYDGRAED